MGVFISSHTSPIQRQLWFRGYVFTTVLPSSPSSPTVLSFFLFACLPPFFSAPKIFQTCNTSKVLVLNVRRLKSESLAGYTSPEISPNLHVNLGTMCLYVAFRIRPRYLTKFYSGFCLHECTFPVPPAHIIVSFSHMCASALYSYPIEATFLFASACLSFF